MLIFASYGYHARFGNIRNRQGLKAFTGTILGFPSVLYELGEGLRGPAVQA